MRRLLALSASAVLVFAQPLAAQRREVERPPVQLGHWDVASASWADPAALDGVADAALDASQIFDNRAASGAIFVPGAGKIVMDWGVLSASPENEIFAADIGYATTSTTPVDLTLRIHPFAQGHGDPGRVRYEIPLSGLPGSPDGLTTSFSMSVGFDTALLPDASFGWSYEFSDNQTGVLLVDPLPESGVEDLLDLYDSDFGLIWTDGVEFGLFASTYFGLVGSFPSKLGWPSEGSALPGTAGFASLFGAGALSTPSFNLVDLSGALPNATTWLVVGSSAMPTPFKGGTLIPEPMLVQAVPTDASGHFQLAFLLDLPTPADLDVYAQCWFPDGGGPKGWASSNTTHGTTR